MTVVAADVKTRCADPVIQAALDARVTVFITEAELRTNRRQWGAKADLSVIFLAAHLLLLDAKSTAGKLNGPAKGPLTAEAVGPLSRSFAGPIPMPYSDQWYASTSYGSMYLELRSSVMVQRTDFDPDSGNSWGCF